MAAIIIAQSKQQRDHIAEAAECGGRDCGRGKRGIDDARCPPRERADDCAARVDDCADAGRGRAQHGHALLGRAQSGLGEMLWRPPAAEPGVVRWVEDEVGPVAPIDDLAGEDDLVANLDADLAPGVAEIDGPRPRSRREVEIAGRKPREPDRRKQRAHRADIRRTATGATCGSGQGRALRVQERRRCWWRRRPVAGPWTRPRGRRSGASRQAEARWRPASVRIRSSRGIPGACPRAVW